MNLARVLWASPCGDKVWAGQIQKKVHHYRYISRLMKYDFQKKSHFLYDYEHADLILSVLVSEVFSLALSGGNDWTLVLHDLKTGKTIKRFDMKYGDLCCLFDLGTVVAVGDYDTMRFLDLQTKEIDHFEVRAGGEYIQCMNLSTGPSDQNHGMTLLVGGAYSNKIVKLRIPQKISRTGKDNVVMPNRPKKTEKFIDKMTHLENENKRLREENQRLKDMLKKEEKEKTDVIFKFEKKSMELSKNLKSQQTINAKLEQDLNQLKNQLTTLKSKKTRSNPAKGLLLIYQALNKNRKIKSDVSSRDSDQFPSHGNPDTQSRLEEVEKRISQRENQIKNLHRQIEHLQDREDEYQTLSEEFDRLDRYHRRINMKNSKVKEIW